MQPNKHLYAVFPAEDAVAVDKAIEGCRVVTWRGLAAVVGAPPRAVSEEDPAIQHDHVIGEVLETSSAVIPFRMGIQIQTDDDVVRMLAINAGDLTRCLRRVSGRVEMGFKAILSANSDGQTSDAASRTRRLATGKWRDVELPFALEPLHAFARRISDRREQLSTARGLRVFEACYLIDRGRVDEFLDVFDELCNAAPDVPCMASGPWAPYSFCDLELAWRSDDLTV